MKTKGNGGYQIIDFEGQAPNTLDANFFENAIARGKPLWISNLVYNDRTYCGVATIKSDGDDVDIYIGDIVINIDVEDGSTTYKASAEPSPLIVIDEIDCGASSIAPTGTYDEISLNIQKNKMVLVNAITTEDDTYVNTLFYSYSEGGTHYVLGLCINKKNEIYLASIGDDEVVLFASLV